MKPALFVLSLLALAAGALAQEITPAQRELYEKTEQLMSAGDWRGAREAALRLVAESEGLSSSRQKLAFLNRLANLDQRLGHYGDARQGYEKCLAVAVEALGQDSPVVSQLKNNLAALLQVLGEFEEAERLNREALALREQLDGKGSVKTVPAMSNLASLLWCLGDLQGAESLFRDALSIRVQAMGVQALDTARSRANLGGLLYYRNQLDEADSLVKAAAAVFERESGAQHPETLDVLLFQGEIERASGRAEPALSLYQRVLEGRVKAFGGREHVEVAEAGRRVGDALRELGRYAEAMESYRESDRLYRTVLREDHPDRQEGLYGLGLAAFASGQAAEAKTAADECERIEFRHLEAILQFTDERQRLAYLDFFKSQHLHANLKDAEAVAGFLLRQKGLVTDSLVEEARLMKEVADPVVVEARQALAASRAEFRSAFLSGTSGERSLEDLETLVKEKRRELMNLLGGRDLTSGATELSLDALRQGLAEGEVLLDFLKYDQYAGKSDFVKHYAVAVTTRDAVAFFDCGEAGEIDDLVARLITLFAEGEPDDKAAHEILSALRRLLIQPVEGRLNGAKTLILSPEGSLSFIPFACLVDERDRFLIESYDLRYVASARELLRAPAPGGGAGGAVLVGNPAFDMGQVQGRKTDQQRGLIAAFDPAFLRQVSQGLAPLEGALEEVRLLGPLLRDRMGVEVLTMEGAQATEAALKRAVRQPRILHLATHGLYLPAPLPKAGDTRRDSSFVPAELAGFQNPMFGSWIALAGASGTVSGWSRGQIPDVAGDGVLMANEVAELDLEGTLLVTLSACDTASGEATSGDGVLGLRRGFRLAGAENVLSTLWPISDAVTVPIMRQFYEGLDESPYRSLSATQRDWLVKLRDDAGVVEVPGSGVAAGEPMGLYWAVLLAGPFLLGR